MTRVGDVRLGWGESLVWDERRQRLYFVDCRASTLHWLDDDDATLQRFRLPSMPTGIVPTDESLLVGALDDGLHVIDPDGATTRLVASYPPELGGRCAPALTSRATSSPASSTWDRPKARIRRQQPRRRPARHRWSRHARPRRTPLHPGSTVGMRCGAPPARGLGGDDRPSELPQHQRALLPRIGFLVVGALARVRSVGTRRQVQHAVGRDQGGGYQRYRHGAQPPGIAGRPVRRRCR
jgi:hypothetical protein